MYIYIYIYNVTYIYIYIKLYPADCLLGGGRVSLEGAVGLPRRSSVFGRWGSSHTCTYIHVYIYIYIYISLPLSLSICMYIIYIYIYIIYIPTIWPWRMPQHCWTTVRRFLSGCTRPLLVLRPILVLTLWVSEGLTQASS